MSYYTAVHAEPWPVVSYAWLVGVLDIYSSVCFFVFDLFPVALAGRDQSLPQVFQSLLLVVWWKSGN